MGVEVGQDLGFRGAESAAEPGNFWDRRDVWTLSLLLPFKDGPSAAHPRCDTARAAPGGSTCDHTRDEGADDETATGSRVGTVDRHYCTSRYRVWMGHDCEWDFHSSRHCE